MKLDDLISSFTLNLQGVFTGFISFLQTDWVNQKVNLLWLQTSCLCILFGAHYYLNKISNDLL